MKRWRRSGASREGHMGQVPPIDAEVPSRLLIDVPLLGESGTLSYPLGPLFLTRRNFKILGRVERLSLRGAGVAYCANLLPPALIWCPLR